MVMMKPDMESKPARQYMVRSRWVMRFAYFDSFGSYENHWIAELRWHEALLVYALMMAQFPTVPVFPIQNDCYPGTTNTQTAS